MKIILDLLHELALVLAPLVIVLALLVLILDVQADWLLGLAIIYLTGAIVRELRTPRKS